MNRQRTESSTDENKVVTSGTVLCIVAFTLSACAGSLLNASLYSTVADYYGVARELSNLMAGALYLLVFLAATHKPSLLDAKTLTIVALGCAITAGFVLEVALPAENAALTVVGFLFYNVLAAWANVMTVLACTSLASNRSVLVSVTLGLALGEVVAVAHPDVSYQFATVEILLMYAAVVLLLYPHSSKVLKEIAQADPTADLEVSNPESFLEPTHPFFACVLLFSVVTGYGLTLNEVDNAPQTSIIQAVIMVCIALWMILYRRDGREDLLFSCSVLLVVASFIIVPFTLGTDITVVNILLRVGVNAFTMLMWMTLLAMGRRNLFALLPSFSLALGIKALGIDVGAVLGHTTNNLAGADNQVAAIIADVVLFVFVAFLWLGFRRFSFSDTIKGVVHIEAEVRVPEAFQESPAEAETASEAPAGASAFDEYAAEIPVTTCDEATRAAEFAAAAAPAAAPAAAAEDAAASSAATGNLIDVEVSAAAEPAAETLSRADGRPVVAAAAAPAAEVCAEEASEDAAEKASFREPQSTTMPPSPAAPAAAAVEVPASPSSATMDDRIQALSEEHGLTARETEIFALLARGRNAQFIMDHFVISRNTVKSHVRHIYTKLGVHSQQELINLVEGAECAPEELSPRKKAA